jgi:hypothetical protein
MSRLKRLVMAGAAAAGIVIGLAACMSEAGSPPAGGTSAAQPEKTQAEQKATLPQAKPANKTMRAFASDLEMRDYFRKLAEEQKKRAGAFRAKASASMAVEVTAAPAQVNASTAESVTNVQHAGVDEGDIVKVHGDYLVVLRRGRLFTVAIGDGRLKPVSMMNAYGPEMDPSRTWYDEMLISGDTIVVIGYSYERGGTEVGLFAIDDAGRLTYRSTYHLRSNDYYSSRNYASRLIGNKLIFYSPMYFYAVEGGLYDNFPAVRKWHAGAAKSEFKLIVAPERVYRPAYEFRSDSVALHTVTVCDLANGSFDCKATSVVGPPGNVFYVSPDAVYVWVTDWTYDSKSSKSRSLVYRMPLDGGAPQALRVSGSPVDQFSFLQSDDQHLNVLVRSDARGDSMWSAEFAAGGCALLRVPLSVFSDGSDAAPKSDYKRLPKVSDDRYTFQNRFVGDYLLYGSGSGWWSQHRITSSTLYIVDWRTGESDRVELTHGIDRIDQLGADAVVVGTDGRNLHFSSIRLGRWPEVAGEYVRMGASQGELRSHGFFYKPEGADSGTLGLPISLPGRKGYEHLFENSAAVLFLKNTSLHFEEVGELAAESQKAKDDDCKASCVDWYGNARPLFLRGRIFALMGYELVEGRIEKGRIRELQRVDYAPQSAVAEAR